MVHHPPRTKPPPSLCGTSFQHYHFVLSPSPPAPIYALILSVRYSFAYPPARVPKTLAYRAAHSQDQSPPPSDCELTFESPPPPSAVRLEELSLGVLNKLSPGNLKKATDEFMKEWEKSLVEPVKDKAC